MFRRLSTVKLPTLRIISMPHIYDNYDRGWTGGNRTNNFGYEFTGTGFAGRSALFREGEKRPRVTNPGPSAYSRRSIEAIGPKGVFTFELPGYPGSYETNGFCENFGTFYQQGGQIYPEGRNSGVGMHDSAYLQALSALNANDIDLGTALAELDKSAQLVHHLAEVSVAAARAIKQRNVPGLLDAVGLRNPRMNGKGVVDAWLTYWWGVRPIAQDVAGAVSSLVRQPEGAWRMGVKKRRWETRTQEKVIKSLNSFTATSSGKEVGQCVIEATRRELTSQQDIAWSLGLDDGFSTLWELTPYSCVVDWILPIGTWFQGVNAVKYYNDWLIVLTHMTEETVQFSGCKNVSTSGGKARSSCSGHLKSMDMKRTVLTSPVLPTPRLKMPSLTQMATGLSLMASLMGGSDLPRYIRMT
jgi:hypothetical protein